MSTAILDLDTRRVRLIYALSLALSIAFVLIKATVIARYVGDDIVSYDNDSLMRLVSVRSWLAGQAWFDTVEYRLMPPEGVQMHWSRYIDAVLGGMIVVFSRFMPVAQAEIWAISIWPVVLSIALILVVGSGARRIFGSVAASFAVLTTAIWPVTQQFYFLPGKIDHHNIQIFLIVLLTLLVIAPRSPLRAGVVAGLCAAFALAIGLETLLFILALGLLLFLRANLRIGGDADPILAGFSLALVAGAVVFWLGQTPPSRWSVQVCDQLGLPVISLTVIACIASLVPMAFARQSIGLRFAAGIALTVIGCAIAWPLLGPCLGGPYGDLPPEVQEIISGGIVEARPGIAFAQNDPVFYFQLMGPAAGGLILGGLIWRGMPTVTVQEKARRDALGMLLLLSTVGILASFSQIRLLLMSAPAVPLVVGLVMALLVQRYLDTRAAVPAVVMLVSAIILVAPLLLKNTLNEVFFPDRAGGGGRLDSDCRETTAMAALNALPPSVFLTSTNLGPPLLAGTHHSTISGPYHRSPAAFANGRIPLRLNEAEMRAYVDETNATHLMLCGTSRYDDGFATALTEGATADWLAPISIDAGEILVFEIVRDE